MKKTSKIFLTITVFALLLVGQAPGQVNQLEFIRNQNLRVGFHAKLWEFEDDSRFVEFALPTFYSTSLSSRLSFDVIAAPFGSVFDPSPGKSIDFTSISDTYVRGSYILGDNRALLTVGLGIPSGKTELDAEELALASIAANRPLANPVTNFGTGFNINVGLAVAHEVGPWVFGFGVGYSRRGEYDLNSQGATIDPGDEFNVTVGLDRQFGAAKVIADVIYTTYSKDESNVLPSYEAGNKILFNGQLIFPVGIFDPIILSVGNRVRKDNTAANQALVDNGNEFEFRATAITPVSSFRLKLIYLARIYGDNNQGVDGANIQGFGGGLILRVSNSFTFDPAIIFQTGSINTGPDSEIDVTGLELTGGFSFRF